jgi:hypothetical protein
VGDVAYRSRVRVEIVRGPLRRITIPARDEPLEIGVHDEVADHYGVPRGGEAERPTTLDLLVGATAG